MKYPYEFLSNTGVWSQKSILLVCLLSEHGYGCSFSNSLHRTGSGRLSLPVQYAYYSNHAFVEFYRTFDNNVLAGDYAGGIKMPSTPAYAIVVQTKESNEFHFWRISRRTNIPSQINMGPVLDETIQSKANANYQYEWNISLVQVFYMGNSMD